MIRSDLKSVPATGKAGIADGAKNTGQAAAPAAEEKREVDPEQLPIEDGSAWAKTFAEARAERQLSAADNLHAQLQLLKTSRDNAEIPPPSTGEPEPVYQHPEPLPDTPEVRETLKGFEQKAQSDLQAGVKDLGGLAAAEKVEPLKLLDKLQALCSQSPNKDVIAEFAKANPGKDLVAELKRTLKGEDLVKALAYLRNENGRLASWDKAYLYTKGGGTGEASLEAVAGELSPEKLPEFQRMYWTVYGKGDPAGVPIDVKPVEPPAGKNPWVDLVEGEMSGEQEQRVAALPFVPRNPDGSYKRGAMAALKAANQSGEEFLQTFEGLTKQDMEDAKKFYADMRARSMLDGKWYGWGNEATLEEHGYDMLAGEKETRWKTLLKGIGSDKQAALQYFVDTVEDRLDWRGDDEEGLAGDVLRLVGNGKDWKPTAKEIKAAKGKAWVEDFVEELHKPDEKVARLIFDQELPLNHPKVWGQRLLNTEDGKEVIALLQQLEPEPGQPEWLDYEDRVAYVARGVYELKNGKAPAEGEDVGQPLLDHVIKVAKEWEDKDAGIPTRAVAMAATGKAREKYDSTGALYDFTGQVSPEAELYYALKPWDDDEQLVNRAMARSRYNSDLAAMLGGAEPLGLDELKGSMKERYGELTGQDLSKDLKDLNADEGRAAERLLRPMLLNPSMSAEQLDKASKGQIDMANQQLDRGMTWWLEAFSQERDALRDSGREFLSALDHAKTTLARRQELLRAQGKEGTAELTDEEVGVLGSALASYRNSLDAVVAEDAETARYTKMAAAIALSVAVPVVGAKVGLLMAGSSVASVARVGSAVTSFLGAGAAADAPRTLGYLATAAVGSSLGATLGNAVDGIDFSSSEFWGEDVGMYGGVTFGLSAGLKYAAAALHDGTAAAALKTGKDQAAAVVDKTKTAVGNAADDVLTRAGKVKGALAPAAQRTGQAVDYVKTAGGKAWNWTSEAGQKLLAKSKDRALRLAKALRPHSRTEAGVMDDLLQVGEDISRTSGKDLLPVDISRLGEQFKKLGLISPSANDAQVKQALQALVKEFKSVAPESAKQGMGRGLKQQVGSMVRYLGTENQKPVKELFQGTAKKVAEELATKAEPAAKGGFFKLAQSSASKLKDKLSFSHDANIPIVTDSKFHQWRFERAVRKASKVMADLPGSTREEVGKAAENLLYTHKFRAVNLMGRAFESLDDMAKPQLGFSRVAGPEVKALAKALPKSKKLIEEVPGFAGLVAKVPESQRLDMLKLLTGVKMRGEILGEQIGRAAQSGQLASWTDKLPILGMRDVMAGKTFMKAAQRAIKIGTDIKLDPAFMHRLQAMGIYQGVAGMGTVGGGGYTAYNQGYGNPYQF